MDEIWSSGHLWVNFAHSEGVQSITGSNELCKSPINLNIMKRPPFPGLTGTRDFPAFIHMDVFAEAKGWGSPADRQLQEEGILEDELVQVEIERKLNVMKVK